MLIYIVFIKHKILLDYNTLFDKTNKTYAFVAEGYQYKSIDYVNEAAGISTLNVHHISFS